MGLRTKKKNKKRVKKAWKLYDKANARLQALTRTAGKTQFKQHVARTQKALDNVIKESNKAGVYSPQ